jgi:hypothetical protein
MKAIVVILIVLYVVLAFVGCLDRNCAIEDARACGKEELRNEAVMGNSRNVHRVVDVDPGVAIAGSITSTGGCAE